MRRNLIVGACGMAMAWSAWGQQDPQSFHLMQIERVVGGVAGDTSAQAIQLRMRGPGQGFVSNGRLRAFDAAGANPVLLIDFGQNVPNDDTGDRVLVVTEGMKNYTEPAVVGDFTFTNPIPDSYLAAGRIVFEDNGGTIYWSLAVGGDSYTGSTKGSLTNDDDGEFGPPFDGPIPTDGSALVFQGQAGDKSNANSTDYALSEGPGVLTNNSRDEFQIVLPPPGCYPDCDGDQTLTFFDFLCFTNEFNGGGEYSDCDQDGVLTFFDFLCFTNAFNAGC